MAIPLAAAIPAVVQAAGSAANWLSQKSTNQRERQHQEYMYWLDRNNSLEDWHRQNEYNSPKAQMARLKDAGLNPNLVYGGSAGGAAGTASPVPSTPTGSTSSVAPRIDPSFASTGMSNYVDLQNKSIQTDNLRAQTNILNEEARLKGAQVVATLLGTDRARFDLGLQQEMRQYTLDAAKQSLRKLQGEADTALSENERRQATTSSSISEAATRILQMRSNMATSVLERKQIQQQLQNLKQDLRIKQADADMKSLGLNPSDPQWQRVLGEFIGGKEGLTEKAKGAWDAVKKWWKK
ncbi:DNA pilot protein [Flyfo microvirus Tbat2_153]|nr:DNA pilot protein [Flyfo microvirus Tbat2_153]